MPRARQLAIQEAIKGGFSHILMLDDDMQFSPDLLSNFLKHQVPIVALNYARKNPQNPSAMACDMEGTPLSSKGKTGLEEVGWIGFGGILIELSCLKGIELPWFEMRWMTETNDFMGEDYYFCMKARTQGVKIYIDHDESNKCAHIGDFPYREI